MISPLLIPVVLTLLDYKYLIDYGVLGACFLDRRGVKGKESRAGIRIKVITKIKILSISSVSGNESSRRKTTAGKSLSWCQLINFHE